MLPFRLIWTYRIDTVKHPIPLIPKFPYQGSTSQTFAVGTIKLYLSPIPVNAMFSMLLYAANNVTSQNSNIIIIIRYHHAVVENIEPLLNNERWAYKRQCHICYIFIGTLWIIYFMLMIDYIRHRLKLITLIRINVWLTVWIKAYISSNMQGKYSTQEWFILINRSAGNMFWPKPVSILWLSQVSANETRCYMCNTCSNQAQP